MPRPAKIFSGVLLMAAAIGLWLAGTLLGAAVPGGAFNVKVTQPQPLSPAGGSAALVTLVAPVATKGGQFPVLVYFADWDGTHINNRRLLDDLASHGFVIAAVTYPTAGEGMDFSSQAAFDRTLHAGDERVSQRARDAGRVLDWLRSSSLSGQVDMSRVGILGYSFGGAVAAEACTTDPRFKAALNIDGWHFGEAARNAVRCPYMIINDATPMPTEADLNAQEPVRRYTSVLNKAALQMIETALTHPNVYSLTVAGADHAGFAEKEDWLHALVPWRGNKSTQSGNLDILRAYALAFFAKYLLGSNPKLLEGNSKDFPNVEVRVSTMPDKGG